MNKTILPKILKNVIQRYDIRYVDKNKVVFRTCIQDGIYLYVILEYRECPSFICYPHRKGINLDTVIKKCKFIRVHVSEDGLCLDYNLTKSVWESQNIDLIIETTIDILKKEISAVISESVNKTSFLIPETKQQRNDNNEE